MKKYSISKTYIAEKFLSFIWIGLLLVAWVISTALMEGTSKLNLILTLCFIGLSIYLACVLIIAILAWRKYKFYITSQSLVCEKGILYKHRTELPLNRINNVKLNRRLVNLIFGTTWLETDSGSVASALQPEITLLLDKEYAQVLKKYLEKRLQTMKAGEEFDEPMPSPELNYIPAANGQYKYSMPVKKLWLYSFSSRIPLGVNMAIMLVSLAAGVALMFVNVEEYDTLMPIYRLLIMLALGVVLVLIVYLITMLSYVIKYYHYSVEREGDYIKYKYGLIDRAEFFIPANRVNAVILEQSLLQRIFKSVSVKLSVIGIGPLGDDRRSNESRYIMPYCSLEYAKMLIADLLPDYNKEITYTKPKEHRILHFFVIPFLWLMPIVIGLAIFVGFMSLLGGFVLGIGATVILFVIFLGHMLAAAVGYGNGIIAFSVGVLGKNTYIIAKDSVQMIGTRAGFIRRRQGLCAIKIKYKEFGLSFVCRHFKQSTAAQLIDALEMDK